MLSKLFIASAYGQEAAAPAATQPSGLMNLLPLVLIGVIFYFFLIRPQKKKVQEEQKFIQALEKGVEIYTKSGLIGTIVGLTDRIATLEVAEGVKIKVLRTQIGGATAQLLAEKKPEEKK